MVTVKEAQQRMEDLLSKEHMTEEVTLQEAGGRILAAEIRAKKSSPPYPRSPFDGYAVRSADIQNAKSGCPVRLKVVDKIYAGDCSKMKIRTGEAARIMTGAPVPDGADTVIKQEDTDYGEVEVAISKSQNAYENYCPAGEDFREGEVLLEEGIRMDAVSIGIAAAAGHATVSVRRKVRTAIVTTGNELRSPEEVLSPGTIYDSMFYFLNARIRELGGEVSMAERIPDEEEVLRKVIEKATKCTDLIVTTGGVSVGEKDLVRKVLEQEGARIVADRIEVQPGSPTMISVLNGTVIISLSGNPFAAAVHTELFVRYALSRLTGCEELLPKEEQGMLESTFEKTAKYDRYVRGKECNGKVYLSKNKEKSGILSSMHGCNCLVKIEQGKAYLSQGEQIWYIKI